MADPYGHGRPEPYYLGHAKLICDDDDDDDHDKWLANAYPSS